MKLGIVGAELVEKMKANVRRMSIVCKSNPEWGTWGIREYDPETGFVIGGRSGSRTLHISEAAQYWQEAIHSIENN